MNHIQYVVTGAPGAGKSTALNAFIELHSPHVAFDIDWLAVTGSALVGKDIIFDRTTWKPYTALWFEVLHAVHRNRKTPVFFAPIDPGDVERYGQPTWCSRIQWLRLDCDDALRRSRLRQRPGWTEMMIAEALEDAHALRRIVPESLDTGALAPDVVAANIRDWVSRPIRPN